MNKYEKSVALHSVYSELIQTARYRGLTTYAQIARVGNLPPSGSAMASETGKILELISEQERFEGRPMLSAVCVSSTNFSPGEGFYGLAKRFGHTFVDTSEAKLEFWNEQLQLVYKTWDHRG
jgi:hypothetical protein